MDSRGVRAAVTPVDSVMVANPIHRPSRSARNNSGPAPAAPGGYDDVDGKPPMTSPAARNFGRDSGRRPPRLCVPVVEFFKSLGSCFSRFYDSLDIPTNDEDDEDEAINGTKVLCFRAKKVTDLWKVSLALLVGVVGVSFAIGAIIDSIFFDGPLYYSFAFTICAAFPWALLVLRFFTLVSSTDHERSEAIFDLLVFILYIVLLHMAAPVVFELPLEFGRGIERSNSAVSMSQAIRDYVQFEEFSSSDTHIYKNMDDIATQQEFCEWRRRGERQRAGR